MNRDAILGHLRSWPLVGFQIGDATGDQVREPQRLRNCAMNGQLSNGIDGLVHRNSLELQPYARAGHRGAGPFDQSPLTASAGYMMEQGVAYRVQIRFVPRDHDNGEAETFAQGVDVNDIETGNRDPLEQDQLDVLAKAAGLDGGGDLVGRVDSVAAHAGAQHTVEPVTTTNGADQVHIPPVVRPKGTVVETDGVVQGSAHGNRLKSQA